MLIDYKGHKILTFSDTHGMYRRLAIPDEAGILTVDPALVEVAMNLFDAVWPGFKCKN
jgi:hypothetical protein